MSIFGDRLRAVLKEKYITQKELAKELEFNYKSVNSYIAGLSNPSLETLAHIAKFLNVSADYFVGIIDEPRPILKVEDPHLQDILMIRRSYGSMTEEQRKAIVNLVTSIVNKP